jgi:hypothetical protein
MIHHRRTGAEAMSDPEFKRESRAPGGNYYGGPRVVEMQDGRFMLQVEDYGGWPDDETGVAVSRAFAEAWFAEFPAMSQPTKQRAPEEHSHTVPTETHAIADKPVFWTPVSMTSNTF